MDPELLRQYLTEEGATLVGIGDVGKALPKELLHLRHAVAIAVNQSLRKETVELLIRLQALAEGWLKAKGCRSLSIPPDSDRRKGKLISRLYKHFCHKTAATCSGLGWVGKNGLLINPRYGSRLSWATVLTDAALRPDEPVRSSGCGECSLCVQHCPSGAVKGLHWSLEDPMKELVSYDVCLAHKESRNRLAEKPNCGFCITVCPYSRKGRKRQNT